MTENERKTFTVKNTLHLELAKIKLELQEKAIEEKKNTNRITFDNVLEYLLKKAGY